MNDIRRRYCRPQHGPTEHQHTRQIRHAHHASHTGHSPSTIQALHACHSHKPQGWANRRAEMRGKRHVRTNDQCASFAPLPSFATTASVSSYGCAFVSQQRRSNIRRAKPHGVRTLQGV